MAQLAQTLIVQTPVLASPTDPERVLREVLQLQLESQPDLDVATALADALAHPDKEVVDSLGAVSVVCALYGAYSPDTLIPQGLLTHKNFTTLNGLRKVVQELDQKARH